VVVELLSLPVHFIKEPNKCTISKFIAVLPKTGTVDNLAFPYQKGGRANRRIYFKITNISQNVI
jgi:hypothetical protein